MLNYEPTIDNQLIMVTIGLGRLDSFVGLPAGASGSYVMPIGFEMLGQWRINLTVTAGSTTGVVHLEVDEFR